MQARKQSSGTIGSSSCSCHALPAAQLLIPAGQPYSYCCRAYPEAFTLRCFAFQPSDEQVEEDKTDKKHLLMFPPAPAPAEDGAPRGSICAAF